MEFSTALKPCERRYHIKCKIVAKEVTFDDVQSKGTFQTSDTFVFLIPLESDERTKFFMAWLPDTDLDAHELGLEIADPVFAVCRVALWRRTQHVNEYHMLVMTKSTEEELKRFNNRIIDVVVLGEQEEMTLDEQRDYTLPYKKHYDDHPSDNLPPSAEDLADYDQTQF